MSEPYRVPFIRPVFPTAAELSEDFERIAAANWYTNFGPEERGFARAVGEYVGGGRTAVTFSNATVGLIGALMASLGRGDGTRYVLVPSFTFAAGVHSIQWCGYKPLFIDIEAGSLQPSEPAARAAVGSHGAAIAGILLCNTFGIGNLQIDTWEHLAQEAGLPLIIDSAAGFGSEYAPGRRVGTAGACEVFSFHATKPFAIGEGGAVVTADEDLAARLRSFTNFGFDGASGAVAPGLNGKLQELSAAIGLRQLGRLDAALASRQRTMRRYADQLAGLVEFPWNLAASSVCFASALFPTPEHRDRARTALTAAGVEVRAYYSPPVHRQPQFESEEQWGSLAETVRAGSGILSLPVHEAMSEAHEDVIVDTIVGVMTE
ncbi:DegT/DnrJ/EryC1/StrS family aminotransferase [soil metagenome]